jgi:DNA polymerase-3 subunit gamma/tau
MAPATSSAGAGSFAGPPAARPGGAPADGGSPGDEPPPDDDPGPRVVDDTAASFDDEDIAELGEVGLPVVQRILGATVIDDGAS